MGTSKSRKEKERPQTTAAHALEKRREDEGELRRIVAESESIVVVARGIAERGITRENVDQVGEVSQALVRMRKAVIAHHKPIKDAINEAGRKAREQEALYLKPITETEALLTNALSLFRLKEREREQAAKAIAALPVRSAVDADDIALLLGDPEAPAPQGVIEAPAKVAGVGFRDGWGWELVDESKVRDEFFTRTLNRKAIDNLVDGLGPAAENAVGAGSIKVVPKSTPIRRANG